MFNSILNLIKLPNFLSSKTINQVQKVSNWIEISKGPLDISYIKEHYKKLSFKELLLNPNLTESIILQLPFIYFDILTRNQNENLSYLFESIMALELPRVSLIKFFKNWKSKYFKTYSSRLTLPKNVGNILGNYVKYYYNPRNQISFINEFWNFYQNIKDFIHKDKKYEHETNLLNAFLKYQTYFNNYEWNYLINKKIITYFPDKILLPKHILKIFYIESSRLKPGSNLLIKGNLTWKEYDILLKQYNSYPLWNDDLINQSIPHWFWIKYLKHLIYGSKKTKIKEILKKTFINHQYDQDLIFLLDLIKILSNYVNGYNLLNPSVIAHEIAPYLSEYYICHMNKQINLLKIVSTQKLSTECLDWLLKQPPESWDNNVYVMISLSQYLTPYLMNKHSNKLKTEYLIYNPSIIEYPYSPFSYLNNYFHDSNLISLWTPLQKVNKLISMKIDAKLDPEDSSWIIIPYCKLISNENQDTKFKVYSLIDKDYVNIGLNKSNLPIKILDSRQTYMLGNKNSIPSEYKYRFFAPQLTIIQNTIKYIGNAIKIS